MHDWNAVATVHEDGFQRACQLLGMYDRVDGTHYHNVLVMKVENPQAFLDWFAGLLRDVPEIAESVSRVVPGVEAFDFADAADFEAKARAVALGWSDRLAGQAFHVRLNRRGMKGALSTQREEQFLDGELLAALEAAGTPGRITFDHPDAIIDIETIDHRAAMSLWTAEQLDRYPFLKLD